MAVATPRSRRRGWVTLCRTHPDPQHNPTSPPPRRRRREPFEHQPWSTSDAVWGETVPASIDQSSWRPGPRSGEGSEAAPVGKRGANRAASPAHADHEGAGMPSSLIRGAWEATSAEIRDHGGSPSTNRARFELDPSDRHRRSRRCGGPSPPYKRGGNGRPGNGSIGDQAASSNAGAGSKRGPSFAYRPRASSTACGPPSAVVRSNGPLGCAAPSRMARSMSAAVATPSPSAR